MKALINSVLDLIGQEPALFAGLVTAAVALAIAFGVKVSPDQQGAIQGVAAAALALAAALYVRSKVTPTGKLPSPPAA